MPGNVFLAPMAGVTDLPFRMICRKCGAALAYTEMVSAKALSYNNVRTGQYLFAGDEPRPRAVQLFGKDAGLLAETAARLKDFNFDIIDINMGCPAPKIVKNGEGAALMKTPELIGEIVKKVSGAAGRPVTVKIRKGFDGAHMNAVYAAQTAEYNGAAAVTVHGRLASDFYGGAADLDIVRQVKGAVKIPIIGNGDVCSPESAAAMLDYTGCDAVMVGRAACGNPWIFERINAYLQTGAALPEKNYDEKIAMALRHAQDLAALKGERAAVPIMRKHISWYVKDFKNAARLKALINAAETIEEFKQILESNR